MQALNLPQYPFRMSEKNGKTYIFDTLRKKQLVLTPEEWVRQHFVQFLIQEKGYAASLIAIEKGLKYNTIQNRADIVIYNKQGEPYMIVECKRPTVKITQDTFDQVARYNMAFKVELLVVTNGMQHFCCQMNYNDNSYRYLETIPPCK